nr:hypothetical protein [Mycoplasmopsis agalactiae]
MNGETAPSEMPTEHVAPKVPESDGGSRTPESTQPSGHGGNGTQGSGTEGTTPRNGDSTNSGEQPMRDDPGTANNETEVAESEPEKKLEVLYTFFNGYGNIEEKLKNEKTLGELKDKFYSIAAETTEKFRKEIEEPFFEKLGYEKDDLDSLIDIFDEVTNLSVSSTDNSNNKKFTDLFEKVKTKLAEAYEKLNK